MIRNAQKDDAEAIAGIYNHYVRHSVATFEEIPVSTASMWERVEAVQTDFPGIVIEQDGGIAGYAYANAWKGRSAYRFSAEVSVYLHPANVGGGLGSQL